MQELGILAPRNLYNNSKEQSVRQVLDVAGGTGDISYRILDNHGHKSKWFVKKDIKTIVFDINQSMLNEGAARAKNMGLSNSCKTKSI